MTKTNTTKKNAKETKKTVLQEKEKTTKKSHFAKKTKVLEEIMENKNFVSTTGTITADEKMQNEQKQKTPDVHAKKTQFEWTEYKPKEIEEAIVNLANSGHSASEIGMILRDQYGIANIKKFSGHTVQELLEKHKLLGEIPEDLLNLVRKSVKLDRHLVDNKKDKTAKRGLQLSVSKIRRLTNYYHKTKKIPKDWYYSPEKASLLTK